MNNQSNKNMNISDENQSTDMGNTNPPHLDWNAERQEYVSQPSQENTEVHELSDSLSSMVMKADEKEIAQMFDDTADDEPSRTPDVPSAVDGDNEGTASVPSQQPRLKNADKRRKQNREAQRRRRQKRRADLRASRRTLPLPSPCSLPDRIVHAPSADVPRFRKRQREIEDTLGLGRMSKKMLLRRETHRASRDRIIDNLCAKIVVEKARKAEMDATKNAEKEWLALEARIFASKSVRRDQRDGDLLSESEIDSDGGLKKEEEELIQALPSVSKQKSFEARLMAL